jgi:2-polyprenyl-3-methyl-5-hydroxy-6-metoxy-1,4-benzoquinol methylase
MGIDRHFADFLLCARDGGVDFRRAATLGRLNLFIDHRSLGAVFREHGIDVAERDIGAIRSASGGYLEEFLRRLGAREIASIDASEYEGATLVHDMNQPIGAELRRKFSVVIDGGTLEHVFNFPTAIRNCMEMLEVGGHFFSQTMANNFMGHGFYQFSPELFYRVFSPENGFRVHRAVLFESRVGKPTWYEARDPQDIGERVELINGRQTYLMVHAERVADVPIFARSPQQADYSALWSKNRPARFAARGLRGRLHQWAKSHNDFFLRYSPGFLYDLALATLVRGLPRRGFRRRFYVPLRTLRR